MAPARRKTIAHLNADLAFHQYLWEHSGNLTLLKTLENLTVPLFASLRC